MTYRIAPVSGLSPSPRYLPPPPYPARWWHWGRAWYRVQRRNWNTGAISSTSVPRLLTEGEARAWQNSVQTQIAQGAPGLSTGYQSDTFWDKSFTVADLLKYNPQTSMWAP
jgi:hypothetical protein